MRTSFFKWLLGSLCLFPLALGCGGGPKPVPLKGVLLWEEDGKAVTSASVRFVPTGGGREATGFTGKDGEFSLTTYSSGDGALLGDYTVVITQIDTSPIATSPVASGKPPTPEEMKALMLKGGAGAKKKIEDPVPAIYSSEKTSPLKWKVEGSNTKVEFKLKKV